MQKWSKHPEAAIKVAFVLFDQFSNMCLANCLEPMRAANTLAHQRVFDWIFLTLDGAAVHTSSGLPILPQGRLKDLEFVDYLFVLSSYQHRLHDAANTRKALRKAAGQCRVMIGLDTAPWLMAAAELLEGRRATIHWDVLESFAEKFLNVDSVRHRVVKDGNRITCAGAMASFDVTRQIIQSHLGNSMVLDIDALMLRDDPFPALQNTQSQRAGTPLQRALAVMQNNIERPLTLSQITQKIACPPKTLERQFKAQLGASPGQAYRHMRLSIARQLVESTSLTIAEIALRCGYENQSALSRAFKRRFGASPSQIAQLGRAAIAQSHDELF